tara:strand:+ start:177 stop:425 length:249 start_codon:yes stop_codon:yes gene_type:complete
VDQEDLVVVVDILLVQVEQQLTILDLHNKVFLVVQEMHQVPVVEVAVVELVVLVEMLLLHLQQVMVVQELNYLQLSKIQNLQ